MIEPSGVIAVIEDEVSIAQAIAARLRSEGYVVELAHDGPSGVALVESLHPDLVVLDIMLPGFDGIEVCRRVQADRWVPVLMLTALDAESDLIQGLGVGADDYMTKPFSARELVARVGALVRRNERVRSYNSAGPRGATMSVGGVVLDLGSREVSQAGNDVHLTPTEFELLAYLGATPGRVATRDELLEHVWGYDFPAGGRTIDSHVRSVRRKLGADIIRTVHGVGYAVAIAVTGASGVTGASSVAGAAGVQP